MPTPIGDIPFSQLTPNELMKVGAWVVLIFVCGRNVLEPAPEAISHGYWINWGRMGVVWITLIAIVSEIAFSNFFG